MIDIDLRRPELGVPARAASNVAHACLAKPRVIRRQARREQGRVVDITWEFAHAPQ